MLQSRRQLVYFSISKIKSISYKDEVSRGKPRTLLLHRVLVVVSSHLKDEYLRLYKYSFSANLGRLGIVLPKT